MYPVVCYYQFYTYIRFFNRVQRCFVSFAGHVLNINRPSYDCDSILYALGLELMIDLKILPRTLLMVCLHPVSGSSYPTFQLLRCSICRPLSYLRLYSQSPYRPANASGYLYVCWF